VLLEEAKQQQTTLGFIQSCSPEGPDRVIWTKLDFHLAGASSWPQTTS
jgi:hypothetical protein